jgi:hypothetical protein
LSNLYPMRTITALILILILFGCKSKNDKKQADTTQQTAKTKLVSDGVVQRDTTPALNPDDTIPDVSIPADAIQVTDEQIDSTSNIHIIGNGADIMKTPAWSKLHWKTITFNNYLHDTKVKLKREAYGEGTEEMGNMGLFMSSTDKDARFLITGLNATNRPVDTISIKKIQFYPGQKEKFNYKGINYTFYATGHKMDTVAKGYDNYKLFLTATVKGHTFNQLIASMKTDYGDTDDAEVLSDFRISFIGDVDGDKIPDFYIVAIGNFWSESYFYLSSIAGNKAIVKKIITF